MYSFKYKGKNLCIISDMNHLNLKCSKIEVKNLLLKLKEIWHGKATFDSDAFDPLDIKAKDSADLVSCYINLGFTAHDWIDGKYVVIAKTLDSDNHLVLKAINPENLQVTTVKLFPNNIGYFDLPEDVVKSVDFYKGPKLIKDLSSLKEIMSYKDDKLVLNQASSIIAIPMLETEYYLFLHEIQRVIKDNVTRKITCLDMEPIFDSMYIGYQKAGYRLLGRYGEWYAFAGFSATFPGLLHFIFITESSDVICRSVFVYE